MRVMAKKGTGHALVEDGLLILLVFLVCVFFAIHSKL